MGVRRKASAWDFAQAAYVCRVEGWTLSEKPRKAEVKENAEKAGPDRLT